MVSVTNGGVGPSTGSQQQFVPVLAQTDQNGAPTGGLFANNQQIAGSAVAGNTTGVVAPFTPIQAVALQGMVSGAGIVVTLQTGLANAAANTAAVQAAALTLSLMSNGGRLQLLGSGVCYANATVNLYSRVQVVGVRGLAYTMAPGSNCQAFANNAANNVTETAATSLTSSGFTCTLTKTAHGLSVLDPVAVRGAVQQEYNGVWIVQSVPDANTITYVCEDLPSAATATGTVLVKKADIDISIEDLWIDGNYANQTTPDTVQKMMVVFAACYRPAIRRCRLQNAYKYCVLFNWVSEGTAEDCFVPFTPSDAFDVRGLSRGIVINRCHVDISGDDCFPICNGDLTQYEYARGDTSRIVVRDCFGNAGAGTNVSKINGGGASTIVHRSITFQNVRGSAATQGIVITDYTAGGATLTSTRVMKLVVDNVDIDTTGAGGTAIALNQAIDYVEVRAVRWVPVAATAQNYLGTSTTGSVGKINVLSALMDCSINSPAATVSFLSIGYGSTVTELDLSGLACKGGTSSTFGVLVDGTLTRAFHRAIGWTGAGFLFRLNSDATPGCDAFFEQMRTTSNNSPVDVRVGCNLTFNGWKHNNSWPLNINGTGTVNLRGGIDCAGASINLSGGMVVNNCMEKYQQAITSAASITPDLGLGPKITVSALAAAITINNPLDVPEQGVIVQFYLSQDGTGGRAVTWGANYIFPTAWSNSGNTASKSSVISFVSDGTKLVAIGANAWY